MEANNKYLMHHGVKGMRWGVRKARKSMMSDDAREAKAIKKKKLSEMSNAELRKLNDRQNLERTHNQLNPSTLRKAAKFVATAAVATSTVLTLHKNSKQLIGIGKAAVDSLKNKPSLVGYLLKVKPW